MQFLTYLSAFLLVSNIALSQTVQGVVYDSTNKQAIAYALISSADKSYGIAADSLGKFEIDKKFIAASTDVHVAAPGYKPALIPILRNKLNEIALVKFTPHDKFETNVPGRRKQSKKYGVFGVKSTSLYMGAYEGSNFEMALYIQNLNGRLGKIDTLNILFSKTGIFNSPFRIQFYEEIDGVPGRPVTNENIILYGFKPNSLNSFDLSEYHISFPPNGCFVSVEWLNVNSSGNRYLLKNDRGQYGIGPTIALTYDKPVSFLYGRKNGGEWEKVTKIYWDTVTMANVNPVISLDVSHAKH
ncbi:hypothetical protein GCM10023091_03420 [Ravibacter arvi]|uniref:Carboxypeptidase-like regulatory domain-containing protein n=1 Tax=Ravibacter arvi TaxID=2051041 RepID=A0ABP8LN58_9BACT